MKLGVSVECGLDAIIIVGDSTFFDPLRDWLDSTDSRDSFSHCAVVETALSSLDSADSLFSKSKLCKGGST